ncbi:MAG: GDP-mannose 4,6-dehydratase, partial [Eubacteriales bacterium]|nr:GDP-mannose 4,6-dehydratase [Eubacteriales bacterium]
AHRLGIAVVATKLPHEHIAAPCRRVMDLDILDAQAVVGAVSRTQPDAIVHLAAQSSVALSWRDMDLTLDINIKGALHVLQAAAAAQNKPRVLMIGSSEEYGLPPPSGQIAEDWPPQPVNPYAVSKLTQSLLTQVFYRAYGVDAITMRAFNHIGAGQKPGFVVPDFCRQVVAIEQGKQPPVITVGNLQAARDFTDVRDIVNGYLLALRHGRSGETYNIGSGKSVTIETLLRQLLSLSTVPVTVRQAPEKMRPVEVPLLCADISKLRAHVGYEPQISLVDSLRAALEYERFCQGERI